MIIFSPLTPSGGFKAGFAESKTGADLSTPD